MENIYTVASSSSSTTYGNIMTFFKEYLERQFSAGYFKDIYLNSEIAYVNIRRRLGRNTLNEMAKLERPFMNINPQIQPPNGDMYLFDIPLTKNFDHMEYGIQKNTLFPILKNSTDSYILSYKLNRDQIQFEMTITMDTYIQQLDMYKYMMNHFVWDRPFTVRTCLESMIPRDIVRQMCLLSNIDIDNRNNNQIPDALRMLNKFSRYPITYKMRNGTSLDEFFIYYNAEVLLEFTDISVDQVNRKGFADDFYQITFRATIDFNLPGVFVLTGMKPKPKMLTFTLDSINNDGTHEMIPLYTINNFYARYANLKNSYLLYTSSRFQTERDPNTKRDNLDLSVLFDKNYIDVIHKFFANNIPMKTLVDVILLKDGKELDDQDYDINWNNLNLTIYNADDKATYCILIYVNNTLFAENIINSVESDKNDKKEI